MSETQNNQPLGPPVIRIRQVDIAKEMVKENKFMEGIRKKMFNTANQSRIRCLQQEWNAGRTRLRILQQEMCRENNPPRPEGQGQRVPATRAQTRIITVVSEGGR